MPAVRTIETFVIDAVKDVDVLQDVPGCPLSQEARHSLLANCPVYQVDPNENTDNYLPFSGGTKSETPTAENIELWQPGPQHHRSFALSGEGFDQSWQDEYGNRYASFTLKGINFTRPGIIEHPVSTDGVVAWGLQESKIISRVLKASEVLTRRGVSTERIIGLAEPQLYPWPIIDGHTDAHEFVPLDRYKQRIVNAYWRTLPEAEQTLGGLADLTKKFSDMTFLISLRAADTPYRLNDLSDDATRSKVFEHVNKAALYREQGDEGPHEPFVPSENRDHCRYIKDFFAPRAGRNLAKLHTDLAHGFANELNWTALGGIVDLDSVHGAVLGLEDEPVTAADRAEDIMQTLHAIQTAMPLNKSAEKILSRIAHHKGDTDIAMESFLLSYFDETLRQFGNSPATIEHIGEIMAYLGPAVDNAPILRQLDNEKVLTACKLYYDHFFRNEHVEAFREAEAGIIAQIGDTLNTDERLAVAIGNCIYGNMDKYAGLIMEDYICELADPTFDAVEQFKNDGKRATAYTELVFDITEALVLYFSKASTFSQAVPSCIAQLNSPEVRELVAGVFIASFWEDLQKHAAKIATDNIPYIEPTLRKAAEYERPEPLLSGQASQPYVGPEFRKFILSTSDVTLDEIQKFVKSHRMELHVVELPEPTRGGSIELGIQATDAVSEIISPDGIDGSVMHNVNGIPTMMTSFREAYTDFVLLVSRNNDGAVRLGLLVKDTKSFLDTLAGTDASNRPVQGRLFE